MPVKSSTSSLIKWPDRAAVDRAVRAWARQTAERRTEVLRIGYFGSYARGDWGVGSDLDVLVLVCRSSTSFERRASQWPAEDLPVPADVLVYTLSEWEALDSKGRWRRTLAAEVVWVFVR